MATLLVINGPPGVGKTTVARAIATRRAPTLRLDVDEIRSLITGWEDTPHEAGIAARTIVTDMAATFLRSGGDVVVSQLYGRTPDLERLESVARGTDAAYVEVVLTADRDDVRARFIARGGPRVEDLDQFDTLYDRVVAVQAARPHAIEVSSTFGDIDETIDAVIAAVARVTDQASG